MKRSLEATLLTLSVKSDITKAIQYSLNRWPALVYYYSDGQAEIDNLIDERALRGVAIGRRNFLFAGTDSGGECAAAMYTLIGSARLNGIDPEAWCIKFDDKRFYLEFTPSVPLATVPASMIEIQGLRAFFEAEYEETALAVVDTPTQRWKTSNPAGQCEWIGKVARRVLVDSASQYRPRANIAMRASVRTIATTVEVEGTQNLLSELRPCWIALAERLMLAVLRWVI